MNNNVYVNGLKDTFYYVTLNLLIVFFVSKINNSFYSKSITGGLLSMLLGIISMVAFINFSLPIFLKTNPKVIQNDSFQSIPSINFTNNFPMILNIVKRGALPIPDFLTYYNITLVEYHLSQKDGNPVKTLSEKKMRICNDEDFLGRKDEFLATANPANSSILFGGTKNFTRRY